MTNGNDLTGFNETKPAGTSPWTPESYTEAPAAAFPAMDMSQQGPSGTTDKMVNTAAETSAFGTGN
jgi:hypothetical protein